MEPEGKPVEEPKPEVKPAEETKLPPPGLRPAKKPLHCSVCGEGPFEFGYQLGAHTKKFHPKPKEEHKPKEPEPESKPSPPPLFKPPLRPEEILDNVLSEHGLKRHFIDYAIKRSERLGGIHPQDLWSTIRDMDSGVKSDKQIRYIIDDYLAALQAEQEKAREAGVRMSYPVGISREPYPTVHHYRRGYEYPESYEQRHPPPGYRRAFESRTMMPEDVRNIIREEMVGRKREERFDNLDTRMTKLESTLGKAIEDAVKKITPPPTPVGVTKEEIMGILEGKSKDSYIQYLEQSSKDYKGLTEHTLDAMKEERKELLQQMEEAGKKTVVPSGKYTRDETMLLADALSILGAKTPVRDIGRVVIDFIQTPPEKPPTREKVGKEGISTLLPEDLLVEE